MSERMTSRPISEIAVGARHRKDMGDIGELARSIADIGMLHPVVVTKDGQLVAGERRLEAAKSLGWTDVPVREVDLDAIILGEHAENELRKDFTVSERVAIGAAVEALLGDRQGQRTDKELVDDDPQVVPGKKTRELAAEKAGFESDFSYRQAKAVVAQGAPELVAAVDAESISVSAAADIASLPVERQRELVGAADPRVILDAAKEVRAERADAKRAQRTKLLNELANRDAPLPERKYSIIYADPPWQYDFSPSSDRSVENHYPTMPFEDICALDISSLATPDAMLFLWAPPSFIKKGISVIEAWGFELATSMVWVKDKIGTGIYVRQRHEYLLLGKRGQPITPRPGAQPDSVVEAPRGAHSAKPEVVYEIIERMYPDLAKIELFARAPRAGFDAWGNQAAEAA